MQANYNFTDLWRTEEFDAILCLEPDELVENVAFRKTVESEVKLAFRDLNSLSRENYSSFIKNTGKNIFPLVIATDYDPNGFSGAGSTFVLYLEDGSERKITPSLNTHYESYKSCCHVFLGLMTILTPFLKNPKATAWMAPLSRFKNQIIVTYTAVESSEDPSLDKETLMLFLKNSLEFISSCFDKKSFGLEELTGFTKCNFQNIKSLMRQATRMQAEENIKALLKWKEMLGHELWRNLYVMIPSAWPVVISNTRIEIFRNLLDEDKVETNIISSESPRNLEEARTLLGRVVGDRSIARFAFGVETLEMRMKTVALSTGIDVVSDDSIPAIHEVLKKCGITPRPYKSANPMKKCPF